MKKTTILCLMFLLPFYNSQAQEISYEEAKSIAVNFFKSQEGKSIPKVDTLMTYRFHDQLSKALINPKRFAFFIFDRIDDNGYVIVSSEKRSKPVLAYSKTSNFCGLNLGKQILLNQYLSEISDLSSSTLTSGQKGASYEFVEETSPLLSGIEWNQMPAPYNSVSQIWERSD